MRSIKYTAKYGIGFNVPNPIVRGRKEESIDTLMKRLYIMPLPKGNEGLVHVSSILLPICFPTQCIDAVL
jgi:hypothetical protein